MKVEEAPLDLDRISLDTAPLISFVERHPTFAAVVDEIFGRLDGGSLSAVTSPITLLECLVVPCRAGSTELRQAFVDLITGRPGVIFARIDDSIAQQGAELRAHYKLSLADALQVATALSAGCGAILTNDAGLQRVNELRVLIVGELEV